MNELEILKEIGLKEVARKTHIELEILEYIVGKDFKKLARLNPKGYIKILQREYALELGGWLDEYEAFLKEHKPDDSKKIKVEPKILSHTTSDGVDNLMRKGSLNWLFWAVFLVILIFGLYYFKAHNYLENFTKTLNDENKSAPAIASNLKQNIDVNVSIAQNKIDSTSQEKATATQEKANEKATTSQEKSESDKILTTDKNLTNDENLSAPATLKAPEKIENLTNDENLSVQKVGQENISLNQSAGSQSQALERLTTIVSEPKDENATLENQAFISSKNPVWVGIIDLKSGKKRSTHTNNEVAIDLNKDQLIVCGNSAVELRVGDKITNKFDSKRLPRFLVGNGEIKLISYEEFIAMNKGKSW